MYFFWINNYICIFYLKVQVGSPAFGEVLRGDIIAKIGEYDARDVSHADAQMLFRTAGNEIKLVVHRSVLNNWVIQNYY